MSSVYTFITQSCLISHYSDLLYNTYLYTIGNISSFYHIYSFLWYTTNVCNGILTLVHIYIFVLMVYHIRM